MHPIAWFIRIAMGPHLSHPCCQPALYEKSIRPILEPYLSCNGGFWTHDFHDVLARDLSTTHIFNGNPGRNPEGLVSELGGAKL